MKKRRIMAVITSAMCLLGTLSVPTAVFASEVENRDKVYEPSLILPEDIAYTWTTLSSFLWNSETNRPTMEAFTELDKDKKIIVVADNEEVLSEVKAFIKENNLDESLIGYRIESFEDMVPSDAVDNHVYLHWDEMTINQQYFMAELGEPVMTYSTAEKEVPASDVGEYIGKAYMSGCDWYESINYHCETDAYKIKGDIEGKTIAVKFSDDEKYYLYTSETNSNAEERISDDENSDKVIDDSLVLPEETIRTDKALRSFLWDSEKNIRKINAYTALAQDKRTIEVHSVDADVLETVKAFVKENDLNKELIIYILDDEEEQFSGDGIAPELILPEDIISTDKALRDFLWDSEKNIRKINAYTALAQDKRTIEVHSVDADVLETVKAFVKESGLNEELIVYILDDEEEQLTDGGIIEGDANCDNEVNMADAVIIMQSLANPDKYTLSERGKKNADTNKDGITNTDALNIQKYLLGL